MIASWLSGRMFDLVHGNNLVYNTCWEDPALDHVALALKPTDNVMVITSAGCNALDYALAAPNHVYAVDMNPRQNALLDLKIAGIRRLDYEQFFDLFGEGKLDQFAAVYKENLRAELPDWSRNYWDKRLSFFDCNRSFYFRGSSGQVARFCNYYIDQVAKVREEMNSLLDASSIDQQQEIYNRSIREVFWTRFMKRVLGNDATLSLLGVPRAQRRQVESYYSGGIAEFMEDCVETVFARLPIHDNYFWRVYLTGRYTKSCCPNYLKESEFTKLKHGLVDRISTHTSTIEQFLRGSEVKISRFVLLDHMDWLSTHRYAWLESEWQAIIERATEDARVIYRSGGLRVDYVDPARVRVKGRERRVGSLLKYHSDMANELHKRDRVHTYGSFYIADLEVA